MLWLACTALTMAAGLCVLAPLFKKPEVDPEIDSEMESDLLVDQKAVVYANLRDLEFEYKMGRLSDADFKRLEADYKTDAAAILQKLDPLDEGIEKEIDARKAKVDARIGRCPSCGAEILAGKKFCADCGRRL